MDKGQWFGADEIVESIGAGGMGEVFKARDTRLDAVEVGAGGSQLEPGSTRKLFPFPGRRVGRGRVVVSPDGQRFLAIVPEAARDEALTPFVLIVNWPRLLEDR